MYRRFCLIALLPLLFCGCGRDAANTPVKCTAEMMGTFVTVTLYGENPDSLRQAADAALDRAAELEQMLSPTIPDSELCYVNAHAVEAPVSVSPEFAEVLDAAIGYNICSDGALDCTMGRLIALWSIGTDGARVPAPDEITALLPDDTPRVKWDGRKVQLLEDGVQLHFGAVAKGYIADEMKEVLTAHGVESGLIVLGGNVLTIGEKSDGIPWTVAITDPIAPDSIAGTLQVSGMSVVTSGNYERYFEHDGVRYHHILDPGMGCPADSGLASVTIVAGSSLTCDALSTAAYVLGAEEGMALLESIPDAEAVFITQEGRILTTSGIDAYQFAEVNP